MEDHDASFADLTLDHLLGGRVALQQPRKGYRAAIDPVFLAAAVVPRAGERLIDLGCGVGAASLCLAARCSEGQITGLEIDPALAALARDNVARNGWEARVEIVAGDLQAPPPVLAAGSFDQAFSNPPHHAAALTSPSPVAAKRRANVEGEGGLRAWLRAALALLKPKGVLTLIHRADRLPELLALLDGPAGAIAVLPLYPAEGEAASRVLVRAIKGSRAPLQLRSGLVLHRAGGGYSPSAASILAEAEPMPL